MFGIGGFELFLILLFGFLIFGPDKLPAVAKTVGQAIAKFRTAQDEMNKVIKTEMYDPNSDEPFKNPLEALSKMGDTTKEAAKEVKSGAAGVASAAGAARKAGDGKTESFSERKARYDRERAAKKEAEKKAAEEAARKASAAKDPVPAKGEGKAKPATETEAKPAKAASAAPAEKRPTADELYGTKPVAKKPAPKKAAATKEAAAAKTEPAAGSATETTQEGE